MACLILKNTGSEGTLLYFDFNEKNGAAVREIEFLMEQRRAGAENTTGRLAAVCEESFADRTKIRDGVDPYTWLLSVRRQVVKLFRKKKRLSEMRPLVSRPKFTRHLSV